MHCFPNMHRHVLLKRAFEMIHIPFCIFSAKVWGSLGSKPCLRYMASVFFLQKILPHFIKCANLITPSYYCLLLVNVLPWPSLCHQCDWHFCKRTKVPLLTTTPKTNSKKTQQCFQYSSYFKGKTDSCKTNHDLVRSSNQNLSTGHTK